MHLGSLTPAYGRDYKNKKAVLADLVANKDFVDSLSGKKCSLSTLQLYCKERYVQIRYCGLMKVLVIDMQNYR